jgi:6,7-dimethyl-8-ribityllumazine synthase
MATELKNLSSFDHDSIPDGKGKKIGIVVSDWNKNITGSLLKGTYDTLVKFGVDAEDIIIEHVPGSFELTYGAKVLIENTDVDSVIILGCVIQGETPHFTFVCNSVQYNEQVNNTNVNIRLQWRYKPVSDLFIVYTDNYFADRRDVRNRALVLKLTYWWN